MVANQRPFCPQFGQASVVRSLPLSLLALVACSDPEPVDCGAGERVVEEGDEYCIYRGAAPTSCPVRAPARVDLGRAIVCGPRPIDRDELCMRLPRICGDAAVPDDATVDAGTDADADGPSLPGDGDAAIDADAAPAEVFDDTSCLVRCPAGTAATFAAEGRFPGIDAGLELPGVLVCDDEGVNCLLLQHTSPNVALVADLRDYDHVVFAAVVAEERPTPGQSVQMSFSNTESVPIGARFTAFDGGMHQRSIINWTHDQITTDATRTSHCVQLERFGTTLRGRWDFQPVFTGPTPPGPSPDFSIAAHGDPAEVQMRYSEITLLACEER